MTVAAPTAPAAAPAPTAVAATPVGDVVGRPIGVAVREARREEYPAKLKIRLKYVTLQIKFDYL